ncbi:MAG: PLDc N-terminal domain-containing protein [Terracidiphilus sp.]
MLRRFYKASIVCFYITVGFLILANLAYLIFGYERMKGLENLPLLIRLSVGVLGVFSATGIIALWLGMIWDCAFISGLPAGSKAKWLVALVLINWLGALLYYYRVFKDRPTKFAQTPV